MKGLTMLTVVINALVHQESGGNGYCNHMFLLYKCLKSLNSQELECAQLKTVAQTKDLGYEALIHIMHTGHIMLSILITGGNAQGEMRALRCPMYAVKQHTVQNKETANFVLSFT